jgi:hypothetical protein
LAHAPREIGLSFLLYSVFSSAFDQLRTFGLRLPCVTFLPFIDVSAVPVAAARPTILPPTNNERQRLSPSAARPFSRLPRPLSLRLRQVG